MKRIFFIGFTDSSLRSQIHPSRKLLHMLCAKYEFEALFPSDAWDMRYKTGEPLNDSLGVMRAIFHNTIRRLTSADIVIVNVDIFNGICSNDDAFMIGFAHAEGKRIIGYINAERAYESVKVSENGTTRSPSHSDSEEENIIDQTLSRMTACATSVNIQGSIEDCLQHIFDSPFIQEGYQESDIPITANGL